MNKLFPSEQNPARDHLPFATWRHQVAHIHYGFTRVKNPSLFYFMHVDIKDNLPFSAFLLAIFVLKKTYRHLSKEVIFLALMTSALYIYLTFARSITKQILSCVSHYLPRSNCLTERVARICEKISNFVAPTQIEGG
jgi:hypothetical protein